MRILTERQKRFAELYVEYSNATRAYKEAGYKVTNDNQVAANSYKLVRTPKVAAHIAELVAKISSKRIASATEVMEYLTKVMRGEDTEQMVVVAGTGDGCSEARTVDKEISAKDRVKASELLGKRYALFTDKMELNEDITINVKVE